MAITKIMNMKAAKTGNMAAHLKHSLEYICNKAKTDNGILVGSINCLPDFSFEQMIQTKKMFGKTGGRQGYHFVISLEPGEGNKKQMFEIIRRFAEEFLCGEYEAVYAVHNDKNHLHGHLVFNSVNMVTGRKYDYKKGDWKDIIQPITNRLCEEYGLSIVQAEYSKEPLNMNRKEWEKEQSWSDVVEADMRYCRSRAKSVDEFLYFMEELGYEVKSGVHISVKAGKMKRSRRLDTIDEEFSKEKLEEYFTEEKYFGDYTEPKIYGNGLALRYKPKSDLQKKYYAKVYRLHVVQKYRFRYHYTRYKEDLEQMHKLQEEYLFLCRKNINSWADVFNAQRAAEKKVAEIDACKKELYKEHAQKKYQYEKDGDAAEFLFHEAEYRKKLDELKAERKEAKNEKNVAERCLKQNLYACLEVPDDLDIENLYLTDLPKVEKQEVIEEDVDSAIEETVVPKMLDSESVDEQIVDVEESVDVQNYGAVLTETEDAVADFKPKFCDATADTLFPEPEMTREIYESLTNKEKAEWIGITSDNTDESIRLFTEKMKELSINYRYLSEMLDEFMRLEEAVSKENRTEVSGYQWSRGQERKR